MVSDISVRPATTTIRIIKSNGEGDVLGDYQATTVTADRYYTHIWDFIETSDGGYLVVLGIERG